MMCNDVLGSTVPLPIQVASLRFQLHDFSQALEDLTSLAVDICGSVKW